MSTENQEQETSVKSAEPKSVKAPKEKAAPKEKTVSNAKFNLRELNGESFEAYQKMMQSLPKNEMFVFEQYKAVGIFKQVEDPMSNAMITTNKMIGISLVDTTPINTTKMEVRHIENWGVDRSGRHVMADGLNAQIYNRGNPRTNSRFYLLKQD